MESVLTSSLTDYLRGDCHQALEFVNQREIPPAALCFAAHRFQRFLDRQRWPVGSIGCERVIDIDCLQNSGGERDLVALQAVRIAGSVKLLVMMSNDGKNRAK